jgi:phenylacetate-CoA ligase
MERFDKGDRFFNQARETLDWRKRKENLDWKFRAIFRHAYNHSRAYQEIFRNAGVELADIQGLEDLEKLPIVRMEDLVERQKIDFPFGGFEILDPHKIRRIYINPGLIWQPAEREYQDTSWAEALCAAGFAAGDRIMNTFNYHMWPFAFVLDESAKMVGATVIPTGVGNSLMQVKIMQSLKINGFMGTPSFLMTLIQRAEGMGLEVKKELFLKTALVTAEMLPESLRMRLQDKLQMTIRQAYGTMFLGCIGYECQHLTGLHVPDNMLVEVVDPHSGRQVQPDITGEIVATNFNQSFPLIRMATGDLSLFSKSSSCSCGRTSPLLKKILGRIDQATKVRGTFVHPWQTDEIMSRYPEVFKYQVVITRENDIDVMTFVVELVDEISDQILLQGRIERDIKDRLTIKGAVKVVPRGTIPDFHKKIDDKRTWE